MANDQVADAKQALDDAQKFSHSVQDQAAAKPSGEYANTPYALGNELRGKSEAVSRYMGGSGKTSSKSPLGAELEAKGKKVGEYLKNTQ
jgi:hypothetical protein